MSITDSLDIARIIVCFFFLLYSSIQDYKDRRVPNIVFTLFVPIAAALTATDIILSSNPLNRLTNFAIYTSVSVSIFYAIYYIGFFGGADAKMLISLSVAVPWPPNTVPPLLGQSFPIFAISILNNSLLSSVITLPYALLSNLSWKMRTGLKLFDRLEKEPSIKKIGSLIFCVKTEKAKIKPYDMIAEENGKIVLFKKIQEEDLTPQEIEGLPQNTFVIFSVPMLIFITIGFITAVYLGDFVILIIREFLGL